MSRLWVPPKVADDLRRGVIEHNEEIEEWSRTNDVCDQFNRELRKIDADLRMVFFEEVVPVGGRPFRYHLSRRPAVGPTTLITISGPQGEFVEPNSAIFEQLRKGDLWNGEAERTRKRNEHEAERALERQKRREEEDRLEELKDRYNAAFRTQVGWDSRWTQNKAGRRGARKAA